VEYVETCKGKMWDMLELLHRELWNGGVTCGSQGTCTRWCSDVPEPDSAKNVHDLFDSTTLCMVLS
jgi:hypothetical protein